MCNTEDSNIMYFIFPHEDFNSLWYKKYWRSYWLGRCKSVAPLGRSNGNPWGGDDCCPGPGSRVWKRLRFSGLGSLSLCWGRPPRPPPLKLPPWDSSSSGAGVVWGTSQSSVGGETQRLRFLSKTNIAGQRWRRGYPPWQAQYRLQDFPKGTFPLGSSLQSAKYEDKVCM